MFLLMIMVSWHWELQERTHGSVLSHLSLEALHREQDSVSLRVLLPGTRKPLRLTSVLLL